MKDAALVVSGVAGDRGDGRGNARGVAHGPAGDDQAHRSDPGEGAAASPTAGARAGGTSGSRRPRSRGDHSKQGGSGCGAACRGQDRSTGPTARRDTATGRCSTTRHSFAARYSSTARRSSDADRERGRPAGQGLRGASWRGLVTPGRSSSTSPAPSSRAQLSNARQACRGSQVLSRHAHRGRRPRQLRGQRRAQSAALAQARPIRGSAISCKAGVDATQLQPVGYGATRPIAPNDSGENMAKNRRIEFTVRPK